MRVDFKPENDTLCIVAETSIEAMALKYWRKEYDEHGDKVLEVVTDVPYRLPAPTPD
jgi:hypothetical protein